MFELTGRLKKVAQRIKAQKLFEKQLRAEMKNAGNTGADYLDKNGVTDGKNPKVSDKRREHWRDLVKKNGLAWYVKELEAQVTEAMRFRQEILTKKYPLATFKDLTGFVWHDPNLEFIDEIAAPVRDNWETSPEFLPANAVHYQTRQPVC
jgi:hypothetical protein